MNFSSEEQAVAHSPKKRVLLPAIVICVCLLSIAVAGYFYAQWKKAIADPQVAETEEITELTEYISKFLVLPTEEVPTLATVIDREALQEQPFFANAQNGDKVLIYTNARKAILYRPEEKKVIEVAPIFFQEEAPVDTNVEGVDS